MGEQEQIIEHVEKKKKNLQSQKKTTKNENPLKAKGVELLALSGEAGKSKKQSPLKPDVQVGGRRMRSMDKLNITKEQRWRLEASRDKGTFNADLAELMTTTGLSLENLERWHRENPQRPS